MSHNRGSGQGPGYMSVGHSSDSLKINVTKTIFHNDSISVDRSQPVPVPCVPGFLSPRSQDATPRHGGSVGIFVI